MTRKPRPVAGWPLTRLAADLGVTPARLRQRIARGSITATKVGRDWIVPVAEVRRLLADRQVAP